MSDQTEEPTILAWIDLETTGLDYDRDRIIEFAMILTDMDLVPLQEGLIYNTVVIPPEGVAATIARIEDDVYVNAMHSANGLKNELVRGLGDSYRNVEKDVCTLLGTFTNPGQVHIAGGGVAQFDIHMLRKQMPSIAYWFPYKTIDVSCARRFIEDVGHVNLFEEAEKPHRALPDIEHALWQAKSMREMLANFLPQFGPHPLITNKEN